MGSVALELYDHHEGTLYSTVVEHRQVSCLHVATYIQYITQYSARILQVILCPSCFYCFGVLVSKVYFE